MILVSAMLFYKTDHTLFFIWHYFFNLHGPSNQSSKPMSLLNLLVYTTGNKTTSLKRINNNYYEWS